MECVRACVRAFACSLVRLVGCGGGALPLAGACDGGDSNDGADEVDCDGDGVALPGLQGTMLGTLRTSSATEVQMTTVRGGGAGGGDAYTRQRDKYRSQKRERLALSAKKTSQEHGAFGAELGMPGACASCFPLS